MKLKKIAAFAFGLFLLSGIGVKADDSFKMYYSFDKQHWNEISEEEFSETVFKVPNDAADFALYPYENEAGENEVSISEKAQFIYLCSNKNCTWYNFMRNNGSSEQPWTANITGFNSFLNHALLPVRLKGAGTLDDPVRVALRLGTANVAAEYVGKKYWVFFKDSWTVAQTPQISSQSGIFSRSGANAVGYPLLMRGASVCNDNQTFLDTYCKYPFGDSDDEYKMTEGIWIGSNFSDYLEGSSYIILPARAMAKKYDIEAITSTETKFFSLKIPELNTYFSNESNETVAEAFYTDNAGYAGEVILLMAYPANENSEYLRDGTRWECVNNGNTPTSVSVLSKPRDFNDYSGEGSDYYGLAIKWQSANFAVAKSFEQFGSGNNRFRLNSPGISGALEASNYIDSAELKYAYRIRFKPGDTVDVYNPAIITENNEKQSHIMPIIKFYAPKPELKASVADAVYCPAELGIEVGGNAFSGIMINVLSVFESTHNTNIQNANYALYNGENELLSVTKQAGNAKDEIFFKVSDSQIVDSEAGGVKIFKNDLKFKVFFDGKFIDKNISNIIEQLD